MHMGEFAAKYHIENVAFWAILGTIFTWIGLIIVLYSEIKAVIITRERDERQRLIDGGFLSKVDAKIGEREFFSPMHHHIRVFLRSDFVFQSVGWA
jgi:hypothetical protein